MHKRGTSAFSLIIGVVLVLLLIGTIVTVGGNFIQANRDTQTAGTPAYVLGDTSLNMTVNASSFLLPLGYVVGGLIVLGVGVLMLIIMVKAIMKQTGGGNFGGKFGG